MQLVKQCGCTFEVPLLQNCHYQQQSVMCNEDDDDEIRIRKIFFEILNS